MLGVALQWWRGISVLPTQGVLLHWLSGFVDASLGTGERYIADANGTRCGAGPICATYYPNADQRSLSQPVCAGTLTTCSIRLEACFREQATALHYASQGKYFRMAQQVERWHVQSVFERTNQSLMNLKKPALQEARAAAEKQEQLE